MQVSSEARDTVAGVGNNCEIWLRRGVLNTQTV